MGSFLEKKGLLPCIFCAKGVYQTLRAGKSHELCVQDICIYFVGVKKL